MGILLLGSYVFYGWWNPAYLPLIILSTLIGFIAAHFIVKNPAKKKMYMLLGVGINLGILFIFKYYNFFSRSLALVFSCLGREVPAVEIDVLLPVGISFYTFQITGYVIDVYRNPKEAEPNFFVFSTWVTFFPQLVAGPIERTSNLMPQLKRKLQLGLENLRLGVPLVLWGYFLKVCLADRLSPFVNQFYKEPLDYNFLTTLFSVYLFSFQIYGDFAGYTYIARGISRMLGIELMNNFNAPYLATSLNQFWRRWHISLSSWFRDYLYIPLGGNRKGRFRETVNILIVFIVSGVWHGANYTFILWGFLNGAWVVIEKEIIVRFFGNIKVPRMMRVVMTFQVVSLLWVFFRASSLDNALIVFKQLGSFELGPGVVLYKKHDIALIAILLFITISGDYLKNKGTVFLNWILKERSAIAGIFLVFILYFILLFGEWRAKEFIYFQF